MAVTERIARTRALAPSDLFAVDDLLGDARDQLARKGARLEVLGNDGQSALAHERPDGVADQTLVVAEQVVDGEEVRRGQCTCPRSALGDGHALRVPG